MLKFHEDPMMNEFEIVILVRQVWVYVEKREGFGRKKKEKKKLREREDIKVIISLKTILFYRSYR